MVFAQLILKDKLNKMPKNLKDFMNRNNLSESSRNSRDDINDRRLQGTKEEPFSKFPKSREECSDEMSKILRELDKKDDDIKSLSNGHNSDTIRKFEENYDNLAQQIIRYVQVRLRENKERIIKEMKERRNVDLAEARPISRNINQIRSQVTSLRDGLFRAGEYRKYMSQIMVKDFDSDLRSIQYDIEHIRFPGVDVRLDERSNNCFKSDLEKLIIVKDEMSSRSGSLGVGGEDINSHMNRDQIKRTKPSVYN